MGRVTVVGAGVIGLSCALRLLEAGHRVDVLARDLPRETTSAVAAAIWYPYRAWPQERVLAWSRTSYDAFAAMAAEEPDSGRGAARGHRGACADRDEKPWWADAVPDLRETLDVAGGYDGGWTFTAPVVEMPVYLDWLAARVLAAGGSITRLNLHGLPRPVTAGRTRWSTAPASAPSSSPRTRRCTPCRGRWCWSSRSGWSAGGSTASPTRADVRRARARATSSSAAPTSRVSGAGRRRRTWPRAILRRALRLVPELAGAEVLGHKVGLRPARPEVRAGAGR